MRCQKTFWIVILVLCACYFVDSVKQNKNKGGGKYSLTLIARTPYYVILVLAFQPRYTYNGMLRYDVASRENPKLTRSLHPLYIRTELKFLKNNRGIGNNVRRNANSSDIGLWPSVFNLATKAVISANATCGTNGREEFCRLSESGKGRCGICDDYSPDLGKRHTINFAIDGTNRWWQSPALHYGREYEYVTITVDLKQIYQIAYIILKSANSPRPGTWLLENSVDGQNFEPWQYFARTDKECVDRFGIPPTKGKPHYHTDSEVICTSFFSRLTPLENGEIHTSLIQGRPGANETSPELLEFTKARYVRFRLMGLRGNLDPLPRWLSQDTWKDKKLFYSIKDITIGGQCVCNGHAENCRHNVASGHPECECQHHTCGPNCEKCCPLFNQRRWSPGSSRDAHKCEPCNCHGHASSCFYDDEVDRAGLSLNADGVYQGGGVCENCTDFTTGINCENCLPGFFRPFGVLPQDPHPCVKCQCSEIGTTEEVCVQSGGLAGSCKCRNGYSGPKCDTCSPEFRGFPKCAPCPCDPKGVTDRNDCEGECICKANVEGKYCDRCKSGYFGLSYEHPEGCLSCFCSGVTTLCQLAVIKSSTIRTLNGWLITDLKVTSFITPVTSTTSVFSVGNYELPGVENLYWLAPKEYLGNRLEIYGSTFMFNVQWVVMRGDTSGEPTIGPNVVIVGKNGLQMGYGGGTYSSQKMSFQIPLRENEWYVIPNDIKDITTRTTKQDYNKGPVTREQFLSVLVDVKHILLRGTFHTDQIEALLEGATINYGNEDFNYEKGSVEKCSCPSGYTGLSCESCSFGYVRIFANTATHKEESFCGKCDCNGHSETCNPNTGECFCQHNTIGEKCERCAVGYYGNPLRGTPEDCKRCACPLDDDENNFSPSCQLDYFNVNNEGGYVCTQCPKGYTGDHCEICDDGYFGDPLELRNECKPCDCSGGPCDRKTGQCLACKGNTEGWKCEKCKPDHYGDPATSNCKACDCDPIGSESRQCNNVTGQCVCRERFVERTCDQCEIGYGNVTALCQPCSCNPIGSKSGLCDVHTGICDCQAGVEGFRCDACQNLHWGFSTSGCLACNCDPNGSKYSSCDPTTGNCVCKAHYEGRTCDVCKPGYWKNLKKDCIKCHCNEFGSIDSVCDQETGQCRCRPGVTGQSCEQCRPNYYGTVDTGCIECEPCTKKGHTCGKGGKCVCPTLTVGKECERCALNSWGHEPGIGCKACNCSNTGSSFLQCDKTSGSCLCKAGYQGEKCDRCAFGHYGYPNCRKCLCNFMGTLESECQNGDCQCNQDGTCNCKDNVKGSKCNTCKNGTFGLTKENAKGCTQCFCFGRSNKCVNTRYNWDKIRFEKGIESNEPISLDTISLPKPFMGDLTTSYDGYLSVNGSGGKFSVFLTGNDISLKSEISMNELKLNEKYWRVTSGNILHSCQIFLTRECFLLVLQNVTSIVIQGQDMEIVEVLLDSAKPYIPYNRTSHSIEKCDCTPEYTGLSCQNPNKGYYRYFPSDYETTQTPWIDRVIGIARTCDCNGRSTECDADTGHCANCSSHTAGFRCELCDTGYYKDYSGSCLPCLCPSEFENNAESCVAKKHGFVCNCKKGYTGTKCEYCKDSYYRDIATNTCVPCNCHYYGSYSSICEVAGKCQCRPGFQGDKCNQCKNPREYIKDGICTPCDECTQILFQDIDRLNKAVDDALDLFKDGLNPPWKVLDALRSRYKMMNKKFHYKYDKANTILKSGDINELEDKVYNMADKVDLLNNIMDENLKDSKKLLNSSGSLLTDLRNLQQRVSDVILNLENFGKKHVDAKAALKRANKILGIIKENLALMEAEEDFDNKVFDYCEKVSKEVEDLYEEQPELPYDLLEKFNEKIDEIELITREVEEKTAVAELQNDQTAEDINRLKHKIKNLNEINENHEGNIKEIADKIKAINETLEELEKVIKDMNTVKYDDLEQLEKNLGIYEEERPKLEDLIGKAYEHVRQLELIVNQYQNLLNFTKDQWKTIKASGAYEEIVRGIEEARSVAEEANKILEKALKIIDPKDSDKLIDKTNLAHARSDRLKHRIVNLKNISNSFNAIKNRLENFKYSLIQSGKANNELNQHLLNLEYQMTSKGDLVDKLHQAIKNSSEISEKMRIIDKTISNLNLTSRYDLFKKYELYLNLTSQEETYKTRDKINAARRKLDEITQILENSKRIDDSKAKDRQINLDSITAKIKELQNKVLYAKQAAESVNVAMGLSNCSMYYTLPQAEVFRSLTVTFKCANCQLFKWQNREGVLNIKIKNGKAVLNYESDEQTNEISTEKEGSTKIEKTLFVQRTGSLLQMKYEKDLSWKKAQIGSKLLVIDSNDYIQVGDGSPTQNNAYIYKFAINDNNIGLWKFTQTFGTCKGQARVDTKELEGAKPFYAGDGYKMYGTAPLLTPAKFTLPFYFSTFDENALIYLAQELDNPCAFISLTLENGQLRFDVRHSNNKKVSLKSEEKFNDGKTYYAEIAMAYSNKIQQYSLKTDQNMVSTEERLDNKAVFRIKKAQHFVGGVSPTLNDKCVNVNTRSFLGFLSQTAQLSSELVSSGVTQKIGELELDKAWFNGNGSLNLVTSLRSATETPKIDMITFILRPLNANSAILAIKNFGIVSLSNRLLQINLKNGEGYLANRETGLNINDYNVVSVTFKKDKISLTVNGEDEIIYRSKTEDVLMEDAVELTVGSAPDFNSFYGGISDININNEKLHFSSKTVTSFSNVQIGREAPLIRPTVTLKGLTTPVNVNMTNTMQNTERCATTSNYVTDPTAVNFGDQPNSYIQIKTSFWKKDFRLEFEFRTLYASGMLFISAGSTAQLHYNFLEIKDGKLFFHVKGKRKIVKNWPLTFPKKVSDGEWHSIKIVKKNGKKLQVWLDGESRKPVRMPKTAVRNEIFLGGVPNDYIDLKELKEKIRPFRGCMNNLKINEETKLLGKNTNNVIYNNIRQCFPRIEEGAYFGGDAYAIYKEGFRINKILELSFEFRTAEQNGILLSISNEGNYPALSVELQNGAVAMTVDLGNGVQSNVTNNLDSDFALCNNMWHKVTAMYSSSELTINVDGIRKSWVQSDVNSLMDEIDAPLYIGGLPDNAAVGTLKTRENFKGCIRNLNIQDESKDWSDMEELNSVLLNSCPVVPAHKN